MIGNEYQELAARTLNSSLSEVERRAMLFMGLSGEAGEATDYAKKVMFHKHLDGDLLHPSATAHLAKELGDVMWYVAGIATELGISLDDVMQGNVDKLRARYPDRFSSEGSQARVDEQPMCLSCDEAQATSDGPIRAMRGDQPFGPPAPLGFATADKAATADLLEQVNKVAPLYPYDQIRYAMIELGNGMVAFKQPLPSISSEDERSVVECVGPQGDQHCPHCCGDFDKDGVCLGCCYVEAQDEQAT